MSDLGNREIMAANIQRLMERKGRTRTEVCEDLGIKYTTFTDWVKGKTYPRIDKIELMANYFGVSKSELVERSEPDDPHGTVAGTSMAPPLLASRLSEIAAEYRQTKDLDKFVEEIISLSEDDRDALMSFSIKVLSAIDHGKPITPHTDNPQAAPAPQDGK